MKVVSVENLSKIYRLGTIGAGTLREDGQRWWRRLRKSLGGPPAEPSGRDAGRIELQALDRVSFEVRQGEILGIVGRNGAGKSTLLKILSRVTAPTSGCARIRGRVASLLEVGTGFHPELTGRENVFLNGAVLGMAKADIRRNFDAIVEFSGVGEFIDTPVKRYSSGMYVRLAFAVAAHLDPDILIVDEVLAVGDAAFQRKCLGSMHSAARSGRTVLFVSHNLGAVVSLCERSILLDAGRVTMDGLPRDIVSAYLGTIDRTPFDVTIPQGCDEGSAVATALRISARRPSGTPCGVYFQDDALDIVVDYALHARLSDFSVGIQVLTADGVVIAHCTDDLARDHGPKAPGTYSAVCHVLPGALAPGSYFVSVISAEPFVRFHFSISAAVRFQIEAAHAETSRYSLEGRPGFLGPALYSWSTQFEQDEAP